MKSQTQCFTLVCSVCVSNKQTLPSPCRCPSRPPRLSQTPPQMSPHGSTPRYGRREPCPWLPVRTKTLESGPVSLSSQHAPTVLCSESVRDRIVDTHTHTHPHPAHAH